jgi:polar amino acid transport system substrate-binding protein
LANQGEVDGEGLRIAGLGNQYPNLVQVPERFIGISFVAFAKDPQINLNQGWASINPYRISFITGWKMFEANATNARSITKVDTPEQMFKMLDSNRIDLALYTRTDGIALVERMGLPSIAPLAPSLRDVDMYLYLNKRHEALVPKLAQALRYMKTDGALNKILSSLKSE